MIPEDTFERDDSEWKMWPDPPWEKTNEIPDSWFKNNYLNYLYPKEVIVREAIPYTINDGPIGSGIYFLLNQEDIIYVGQSGDIRGRLIQHWNKGWDIQRYWCFGGMPQLYIEYIEAFYIYLNEPYYNEKYPILNQEIKLALEKAEDNKLRYKHA